MNLGAPVGSEAAADLSEDDGAVSEEDEELGAPSLDLALAVGAGREATRASRRRSALAASDGPAQEIADFRGEQGVAAVDGVLDVAQHVGEADLMNPGQVLLAGVAIGNPDFGAMSAEGGLGEARPRLAALSCSTARSERKTQCHRRSPSIRGVVSSEAIMRDNAGGPQLLPDRHSRAIRASRSKPTWWLWWR